MNQPDLVDRVLVKDADHFPKSIAHGLDARAPDGRRHLRLQRRAVAQAAPHDRPRLQPGAHPGRLPADARRDRGDGRAPCARMPTATSWRSTRRRRTSPPTSSSAPSISRAADARRVATASSAPSAASRSSPTRRASGRWPACRTGSRPAASSPRRHARVIRGSAGARASRIGSTSRRPAGARAQGHPGLAARGEGSRSPARSSRARISSTRSPCCSSPGTRPRRACSPGRSI